SRKAPLTLTGRERWASRYHPAPDAAQAGSWPLRLQAGHCLLTLLPASGVIGTVSFCCFGKRREPAASGDKPRLYLRGEPVLSGAVCTRALPFGEGRGDANTVVHHRWGPNPL